MTIDRRFEVEDQVVRVNGYCSRVGEIVAVRATGRTGFMSYTYSIEWREMTRFSRPLTRSSQDGCTIERVSREQADTLHAIFDSTPYGLAFRNRAELDALLEERA